MSKKTHVSSFLKYKQSCSGKRSLTGVVYMRKDILGPSFFEEKIESTLLPDFPEKPLEEWWNNPFNM